MPSVATISPGHAACKTNGILLETLQYVEPRKYDPPPNHLLQTKIYDKVSQNALVQARPAAVHFGGFEIGKKHTLAFSIVNVSSDVLRMHIVPPQTRYFNITYTKGKKFVPGLTVECEVEFYPDEWRYYYDSVRINCPGEENLIVPIHAYPVMITDCFPEHVDFPSVPVGHSRTKSIPLRCEAPTDFEFELSIAQPHPAFTVEPMSGIVPACGETQIKVTFAPTEFLTAHMKLLLIISQFNTKPLLCTFTGTSAPGLLKELTETSALTETETADSDILDPRCLTPLDRARRNRRKKLKPSPPGATQPQDVEYAGLKFPPQINCPHAVTQVLLQEEGRLRRKDLKEAITAKKVTGPSTRQMKETVFEQAVRQNVYEERQNQLRWQVKLGEDQMSVDAKQQVMDNRELAWHDYRFKRLGEPVPEKEHTRATTERTFQRTLRKATELASEGVQFDLYTNDNWAARQDVRNKFAQAARKIIIRKRALDKLHSLTKVVTDWRQKKYSIKVTDDETEKVEEEEEDVVENFNISRQDIRAPAFPTYADPQVKDDMAPDALGNVIVPPTAVIVKQKVPYFNLKVPQQYRLLGYRPHNTHDASSGYVPATCIRPLRTGAEDEIINLPAPVAMPTQKLLAEEYMEKVTEGGGVEVEEVVGQASAEVSSTMTLTPPDALFKPIKYPALHIFNPAPGLQVFQTPMPYAEVDPDFHLCPIPCYQRKDSGSNPHTCTQQKYLDREDVIKGIMSWKKFPSQGLTSLQQTPTLTSVWVPRWEDPFGEDLLPHDVPQLLDGLPDDDKDNILEEEEGEVTENAIGLTPEMVNAQFIMSQTPIPPDEKQTLEKREQELEYYIRKKYNRLGAQIQEKTETIHSMHRSKNLVPK
ncbi:cilia- and flagella-associated protein 221-like isoform X2 [Liolophura sinensis]|uniref:cilia- and flagella-associated protein 221-like isoform X2 n=1 Tax=Liolophura sinensis TaxID=3198878 RepID=UPI003158BC33